MKAVVETVLNSPVPRITLKPETPADEAVLDAILNRNGPASAPDCGYAVVSFERNGNSFQKMTLGLANCIIGTAPDDSFNILTEDGDDIVTEDGDNLIQ